jgi:histidinol-phosphatase (PHP family)
MSQNLCYHTHNIFCDGKNSIEELIQSAILKGVTHIGISSHAPLKIDNPWSLKLEKINEYAEEINRLKEKYSEKIHIFKSLEIDHIPGFTYSFDYFKTIIDLDYTIGSIHLVLNPSNNKIWFIDGDKATCVKTMLEIFEENHQLAVQSYYRQFRDLIETQKPDIIGHLDKVIMNTAAFFDENEPWYQEEITKTLECIAKNNAIIEINTRGLYKKKWETSFPSPPILLQANKMGIPIVISSDAHHTSELLGNYSQAIQIALQAGYTHHMKYENKLWIPIPINPVNYLL